MVMQHVEDFMTLKGESAGLGFYSEQAMESVHHDFKVNIHASFYLCLTFHCQLFWSKYQVDIENPQFGEKLKAAVAAYNARHI